MGDRWSRLELGQVESRVLADGEVSLDLRVGAEARIADPLWMLARQRQVGEFKGEDAASPISVRVTGEAISVTAWRAGSGGAWQSTAGAEPLETRVERSAVLDGPGRFGLGVDAGAQLRRLLADAGLGGLASLLQAAHPLALPDTSALETRADRSWYLLMSRRMPDGLGVLDAITAAGSAAVAAAVTEDPAERVALAEVLDRFATWGGDWVREPDGDDAWDPERLEHRLGVKADTAGLSIELDSPEYPGGRLDWWAFDLASEVATPGVAAQTEPIQQVLLPTPLRYAGMPASRWWELEEGHVHFGDLDVGPADLARLIVAEFATVGADDWYLVPVTLRFGQLARIMTVVVTDTFGAEYEVPSAAALDRAELGAARPWRFFELRGDRTDPAPWLFLAPALAGVAEGRPVEKVDLWRDEDANLAWAAEQCVEGPRGRPLDRRGWWQARRPLPPVPPPPEAETWTYRLETQIPPHWIPLVPMDPLVEPEGVLKRGRMSAWTRADPTWEPGVRGTLLAGPAPRRIEDQEVPIEGVGVTRTWQLARSSDGGVHLWLGRGKRAGRGVFPSGLTFDRVEQDEP